MQNEETVLRSYIRKAIKVVASRRENKILQEEKELRRVIRSMILIEKEREPAYDDTGLNALNGLFLDTGFIGRIRIGYKELRSTDEQRRTYKEHITYHILKTLEMSRMMAEPGDQSKEEPMAHLQEDQSEEEPVVYLQEQDFTMDLEKSPLMGEEPEKTKEEEKEEELEKFKIPGEEYGDTTGIKQAFDIFNATEVKESLLRFWGKMDLEEDRDIFYDNMKEQLEAHFVQWEEEIKKEDTVAQGTPGEEELELEPDIPAGEEELELEPEGEGEEF